MKKKKVLKIILIVLAGIVAICLAFAGFFAIKGAVLWNDAKKSLSIDTATANIRAEDGFVEFDELPKFYVDAVISTEDRKFFTHGGINVKSMLRAVLYDLKNKSLEQGGSTITQQLAKNIWFTQEKKFERKFAEVWAALELERELDKQEIFELYVNTIYFGSGYYGISAAARGYYGKEPSELSDYECAMLAGLPNAPSVYSPDESPELAKERLEQVLGSMQANGVLTEEQAQEVAKNQHEQSVLA